MVMIRLVARMFGASSGTLATQWNPRYFFFNTRSRPKFMWFCVNDARHMPILDAIHTRCYFSANSRIIKRRLKLIMPVATATVALTLTYCCKMSTGNRARQTAIWRSITGVYCLLLWSLQMLLFKHLPK